MTARKRRRRVVLDTNVFVRNFKSHAANSPNRRIVRLWLVERRLQLIVSPELIAEYLEIFSDVLGFPDELVDAWRRRFEADRRATLVNLAARYTASRDVERLE